MTVLETIKSVVKYSPREQWASDLFILLIECPFMKLLGCTYHLRLAFDQPKSGWYKDGKFVAEKL